VALGGGSCAALAQFTARPPASPLFVCCKCPMFAAVLSLEVVIQTQLIEGMPLIGSIAHGRLQEIEARGDAECFLLMPRGVNANRDHYTDVCERRIYCQPTAWWSSCSLGGRTKKTHISPACCSNPRGSTPASAAYRASSVLTNAGLGCQSPAAVH
jgi:hypothetical protein